eukprot:Blabericola_migrator_1__141@NODE_1037_length_5638_cov_10_655717_g714_i0_p2_GENE_NODE_1037_length_5638_cov_10_655717_g714_i0NODE_1037_length_5638_cov_10_655717_g714_i0_p2_ORF_typecomplete_len384_score61_98DUF5025/PF16428_5/0_11DUF1570/PF07607_11/2_3DUF1570/PF07607_11/2_9e02_NODE_1037_length_5638_cov_10_655717_g714_i021153
MESVLFNIKNPDDDIVLKDTLFLNHFTSLAEQVTQNAVISPFIAPERMAMWSAVSSVLSEGRCTTIADVRENLQQRGVMWTKAHFVAADTYGLGMCLLHYLTNQAQGATKTAALSTNLLALPAGIAHVLGNLTEAAPEKRKTLEWALAHPLFKSHDDAYFDYEVLSLSRLRQDGISVAVSNSNTEHPSYSRYQVPPASYEKEILMSAEWLDPIINECTRSGYIADLYSLLQMSRGEGGKNNDITHGILRLLCWMKGKYFHPGFIKIIVDCLKFYYAPLLMELREAATKAGLTSPLTLMAATQAACFDPPEVSTAAALTLGKRQITLDSERTTSADDDCLRMGCPDWTFFNEDFEEEDFSVEISPVLAKLVDDVLQDDVESWVL